MSKQSFWSQKNLGRHSEIVATLFLGPQWDKEVLAPWGHSKAKKKKKSQNVSCYILLERKFDADHFLRKDLGMKINDFSQNLLQSDLNVTLELNLWCVYRGQ